MRGLPVSGWSGAALLAALCVAMPSAAPDQQEPVKVDPLFKLYEAGDYDVVARTLTTVERFESLRADLLNGATSAVRRWERAPRRIHYVFMLDVAKAGLDVQAK